MIGFVVHLAVYIFMLVYTIDQTQHSIFFAVRAPPRADSTACAPRSSNARLRVQVAIVFGIGDGVYNTQIYAVVGAFFQDRSEAGFAS
jgi:hypothetical protein